MAGKAEQLFIPVLKHKPFVTKKEKCARIILGFSLSLYLDCTKIGKKTLTDMLMQLLLTAPYSGGDGENGSMISSLITR